MVQVFVLQVEYGKALGGKDGLTLQSLKDDGFDVVFLGIGTVECYGKYAELMRGMFSVWVWSEDDFFCSNRFARPEEDPTVWRSNPRAGFLHVQGVLATGWGSQ